MYYEINVSEIKTGLHLFATAERSLRTEAEMKKVFALLSAAFPATQYKIGVTFWEKTGRNVEVN